MDIIFGAESLHFDINKMSNYKHKPNDQRAIVKNQNNPAFHKDAVKRGIVEKLNPLVNPPLPKK